MVCSFGRWSVKVTVEEEDSDATKVLVLLLLLALLEEPELLAHMLLSILQPLLLPIPLLLVVVRRKS